MTRSKTIQLSAIYLISHFSIAATLPQALDKILQRNISFLDERILLVP